MAFGSRDTSSLKLRRRARRGCLGSSRHPLLATRPYLLCPAAPSAGLRDGTRRPGCRGSWRGRVGEGAVERGRAAPARRGPRLRPARPGSHPHSPHPFLSPPTTKSARGLSGMRRSPDVSPRRLSDISPQLRQLKYLVVDEAIKGDLKWSRSVEDLTSGPVGLTSIEEPDLWHHRLLRLPALGTSHKSKTPAPLPPGPIFSLVRWRICLAVGSAVSGSAPRHESSPPAVLRTHRPRFASFRKRPGDGSLGPLRIS